MSTIRVIYKSEPTFPATDQHPDAVRYHVGSVWVDAIGGQPTQAEIDAVLAPPLPDLAPYQFRAMLTLSGKEAALTAYLDALPAQARVVAKAKLDFSLSFHRDNDLVEAARQALGLTPAQLDTLWLQAAGL